MVDNNTDDSLISTKSLGFDDTSAFFADLGLSYVPFIGSAMDIEQAIKNPTFGNIAFAVGSVGSDLFGASLIKGAVKTAKTIKKIHNLIDNAEKAEQSYKRIIDITNRIYKNNGSLSPNMRKVIRKKFADMKEAQAKLNKMAPIRRVPRTNTFKRHIPTDKSIIFNPYTVYGTDAAANSIQNINNLVFPTTMQLNDYTDKIKESNY